MYYIIFLIICYTTTVLLFNKLSFIHSFNKQDHYFHLNIKHVMNQYVNGIVLYVSVH